jgi:hypothetical protein
LNPKNLVLSTVHRQLNPRNLLLSIIPENLLNPKTQIESWLNPKINCNHVLEGMKLKKRKGFFKLWQSNNEQGIWLFYLLFPFSACMFIWLVCVIVPNFLHVWKAYQTKIQMPCSNNLDSWKYNIWFMDWESW